MDGNLLELKPCPFCGGEASVKCSNYHYSSNSWGDDWFVECKKCKVKALTYSTSVKRAKTGELVIENDGRVEAIMKWNTRQEAE